MGKVRVKQLESPEQALTRKLLEAYECRCETCMAEGRMYCGQCGGLQCARCFTKHLLKCDHCIKGLAEG